MYIYSFVVICFFSLLKISFSGCQTSLKNLVVVLCSRDILTSEQEAEQTMSNMSFSLPKAALDQLKGFITLCQSQPAVLHNEELAFFRDYLLTMGASLPPKPASKSEPKKEASQAGAATPPPEPEETMEVESEESDVELEMDGVIGETVRHRSILGDFNVAGDKNPDIKQEMGDASKIEMTDEEMESFDTKRSEAMRAFSEVLRNRNSNFSV